jgi:hypothetical protein
MAHFAEIRDGMVARVVVVPHEQEARGQDFLAVDLGLVGVWVQTSYTASIRRRFAGVGMTYDTTRDVFIEPHPFPSWTLDSAGDWQPPVAMPTDVGSWEWNEESGEWDLSDPETDAFIAPDLEQETDPTP